MKIKFMFNLITLALIINCAGPQLLTYQKFENHQLKRLAIQVPEAFSISEDVSKDYLQKMLAYMVFNEKGFYVQPLDSTNQLFEQLNPAAISPQAIKQLLKVDGLIRFDFFDFIKNKNQKDGFFYALSLIDLQQGKIVWRAFREYRGKADLKKLQSLKQYMQNKVQEKSNMPYFVELYQSLKDALNSLENPVFNEAELTERLMNTTEPF
ncbi:hypothetical protein JW964_22915 [candidate division KSB1 bacterium]|nr:hypothetical protein [candidate division KSB1 bacterium]